MTQYTPHIKRFDGTDAQTLTGTQLIHEWAHYLNGQGHDIIDASRGRPSFPVSDNALDAMRDILEQTRGSIFPYGTDALGELHYRNPDAASLSSY